MKLLSCLLVILGVLLISSANAQNMVINPGMEDTISCPPINNDRLYCFPWYRALRTPDYFRENCSINGCCNIIPNPAVGFQLPKSGISYLGFAFYVATESQAREYVGGKLSDSLIAGHKYCVEFWVSPANNTRFITDDIGIYFSHDSVYTPIVKPHISIVPQIENIQGNIISDTAIWTQIYGEFYAQGGEQYLCIGNFKDDSLTTLDSINNSTFYPYGYYFLDDVSVTDCTVGIHEIEKVAFDIYPNPVNEKLYINMQMNYFSGINLEVFNAMGSVLITKKYNRNQRPQQIPVFNLPAGIYFIKLITDKGYAVRKFIKE